jgi:hypothetical protein
MFQGRPDLESMTFFGKEILPRIRRREQSGDLAGARPTAHLPDI